MGINFFSWRGISWGIFILHSLVAVGQHFRLAPLWTSPTVYLLVGELWNVELSGMPSTDYYRMSIAVFRHGKQILSMQSWAFQIHTQEIIINEGVVKTWGPIELVISPDWEDIINKWGMQLPPGEYELVYKIIKTDKECIWTGPIILKETFSLVVVSQLQPLLMFPLMDDTICGTIPVFSWTISSAYAGVFYSVSVAPISSPQDAMIWTGLEPLWKSEKIAIQQWHPIWLNPPLTTGWYAWIVTAYLGDEAIGQSTPARFFYKESCLDEEPDSSDTFPYGKYNLFVPGLNEYFLPHQDTVYLRWKSTCVQQPNIIVATGKGKTEKLEIDAHFIKPWWFVTFSLPEGQHRLKIEQCGKTMEFDLNLYKIQ